MWSSLSLGLICIAMIVNYIEHFSFMCNPFTYNRLCCGKVVNQIFDEFSLFFFIELKDIFMYFDSDINSLLLLFKSSFGYSRSFVFLCKFYHELVNFWKKKLWFWLNRIESIGQFEEKEYLNNAESLNPLAW